MHVRISRTLSIGPRSWVFRQLNGEGLSESLSPGNPGNPPESKGLLK